MCILHLINGSCSMFLPYTSPRFTAYYFSPPVNAYSGFAPLFILISYLMSIFPSSCFVFFFPIDHSTFFRSILSIPPPLLFYFFQTFFRTLFFFLYNSKLWFIYIFIYFLFSPCIYYSLIIQLNFMVFSTYLVSFFFLSLSYSTDPMYELTIYPYIFKNKISILQWKVSGKQRYQKTAHINKINSLYKKEYVKIRLFLFKIQDSSLLWVIL